MEKCEQKTVKIWDLCGRNVTWALIVRLNNLNSSVLTQNQIVYLKKFNNFYI